MIIFSLRHLAKTLTTIDFKYILSFDCDKPLSKKKSTPSLQQISQGNVVGENRGKMEEFSSDHRWNAKVAVTVGYITWKVD